jgi:hypothetical protein
MPEVKKYKLTPENFLSSKERQQLMKTCREHAELDLIKGSQTLSFPSAKTKNCPYFSLVKSWL